MKIRVVQTDYKEFTVQSMSPEDEPFYIDVENFSTEEEARKFAEDIVNNRRDQFGKFKKIVIAEYEI